VDVNLFAYDLPGEAIAQEPAPRGTSRMLVSRRDEATPIDTTIGAFSSFLRPGDLLVLNDSRVIPARLMGSLPTGGKVEIFLLRPETEGRWVALGRPGRKLLPGARVEFPGGDSIRIVDTGAEGTRIVEGSADFQTILDRHGHIPLPPYIRREDRPEDRTWYQTVYARANGSVAAPTAGLHFTPDILDSLRIMGIEIVSITLHVSMGTFRPVKAEDTRDHPMDRESYLISAEASEKLNRAMEEGRRIIAVGTTPVRTLEAACIQGRGQILPGERSTDLFIEPGFPFQVVGGLLTNFHLPRSTLLMLVSAFAGRERVLDLYAHALQSGYRFYSYGDCMLLL